MNPLDSRRYYPTALALYITYFVLGIAATIMGQYKQSFAALWGAEKLADGSYDVSSVVAVIAAIGLGRLIAFPVAGPLSDRLGRRLSGLIGCGLYAIFFLGITFAPNLYVGYVLAVISGMANCSKVSLRMMTCVSERSSSRNSRAPGITSMPSMTFCISGSPRPCSRRISRRYFISLS